MARKKQEIALQIEVNTQEEWDELMKKEGLMVVDVYQDWCGPCKAVIGFFRRVKNEIGDDFLNFAVAKADTIDSLEKYRGKCEPCFLIYGGRSLVGVIRGANPPVLENTIKLKLEEEHKVMKGEMERNEMKDPLLADVELDEKVPESEKEVEEIEREITLALIKPDVVKAGKVDEIIEKLRQSGIEILAQQERNLTSDEAKEFYRNMAETEFFDELITFITSGPSYVLVLAKGDEGIIHEFQELIGPKVLDEAKEKAPNSIRAMYGTTSIENAIHGADDWETAQRELAFFFPEFVVPKVARKKHEEINVQRTLALIRPAAFSLYKDNILEKINNAGFRISMQKEVQLTREDASLFYTVHKDKPFFEELITEMSRGTLLALAIEKQNAVQGWRGMLGPKDVEKAKEIDPSSLRAQFSRDDLKINLLHGSDSDESAVEELKYFFPVEQTIAAIKPDGIENEEEIVLSIVNAKFKIVKTKTITMDKSMAEEFYSDVRDQDYFEDLVTHMESGPTIFMVLSREDAIRGWRSLIGPKDPKTADETYPDCIRAIYGRDLTKNAVYGSDNANETQRVMNLIFGHLEFADDGSLLPQYMDESQSVVVTSEEHVVTVESHEDTIVNETTQAESPRLFESSERILMEPEVSEQPQITDAEDQPQPTGEESQSQEIEQTETFTNEEMTEDIVIDHAASEQHGDGQVVTESSSEQPKDIEEETVNVTEVSQDQEIITGSEETHTEISEERLDVSHQETVVEESEEITIVEDQSIIETKEEVTIVEETVISQEGTKASTKIDGTDNSIVDNETVKHDSSIMEGSLEEGQSYEEKTIHESSIVESSSKEHKTEQESSKIESITEEHHIEEHTEVTYSLEEKTETHGSKIEEHTIVDSKTEKESSEIISQKEHKEDQKDDVHSGEEKTESETKSDGKKECSADANSVVDTPGNDDINNDDHVNTDLNTVPEPDNQ